MFLATIILASAGLQDAAQDKTVTYRASATGLATLVKQLAESAGSKLDADPNLNRQIVLIDVKDAKQADVLAKLADVTDTEWVDSSGTMRLVPSKAKIQVAVDKETAERAQGIAKQLAKYADLATGSYDAKNLADYIKNQARGREETDSGRWNPATMLGPENDYMGADPAGRIFARALAKLDPNILAKLQPDQRIVFAITPTAMQRKLALDVAKEKTLWEADNKVFRDAIKLANLTKEQLQNLGWADENGKLYSEGGDEAAGYPFNQLSELKDAYLIVSMVDSYAMPMVTASLLLRGEKGGFLESRQATLWVGAEAMMIAGTEQPPKETSIKASADSLWVRNLLLNWGSDDEAKKDSRFGTLLRHPEKHEPLSFFTSDVVFAVSEARATNIIAELGDESIFAGYVAGSEGADIKALGTRLESGIFENISKDTAWTLWRPLRPIAARAAWLDRAALASRLANQKAPSGTKLEADSIYAWQRRSTSLFSFIEMIYMNLGDASEDQGRESWFGGTNGAGTAFIGSLDPGSRARLFNGGRVLYGGLMTHQKALLDRMVYGVMGNGTHNCFGNLWDPKVTPNDAYDDMDYDLVNRDATEICPTGIPNQAAFELRYADSPTLYTPSESDPKRWDQSDPSSVAWAIAANKRPELNEGEKPPVVPTRFRLGARRAYLLVFWVGPKDYYGQSAQEQVGGVGSIDLKLDQLPNEMKRQIEEMVKSYTDMPVERGGESGATKGSTGGGTGAR